MKRNRFLSFIIAMVLFLPFLASDANLNKVEALTSSEVTAAITNLKNTRYPEGYCWYNEYATDAAATAVFNGSQCVGFARNVANLVFGSFPNSRVSNYKTGAKLNGWTAIIGNDVTSVEPGDIIRTSGHAAIVHYVDGANIYVAEAWGSSGNTIHYGYFNGTKNNATLAKIKANNDFLGIWRHPDSSSAVLPAAPSLSINKSAGLTSDTITISWKSAQGAESYWLHIYKDGVDYVNKTLNQALTYSSKYPAGNYVAYVVSCNSVGETLSKVEFTIYNGVPGTPNPKISKSLFAANEFVDISWSKTNNTDSYWLHIYKDGKDYVNKSLGQELSYSSTYPAGEYVAYIVACNGVSETLSSVKFTVYDSVPAKPNPKISKTIFSISEKVNIVWEEAKNTEYYWLHIYKDEADYVNKNIYKSLSYSSTYPAGNYVAYIVSGNSYGETISSVSFKVIGNLKVTLNANGGNCSSESITVSYGGTYNSLPKPSRTGYTFDGWYTAASGGTKITETTNVTATTNHTLYAHWTANKYTVTFKPIGGTCDTASKSVTHNSTYGDLPKPTRTGHVFKGWFTAESGGTQITKDSKVTITANQTLYAQWTLNSYTVTLDANGGTVSNDSVTVTYSKGYGTLPEPTRDGYIFLGWFTAADGGTEVTASTTVTTNKDHTLYAHWQKNKVVGDVNADGTFNVADVVMLQKWLSCTPNATLTDWQAADMCEDNRIDVFDLCLMKRELLKKS